jgi:hypothetical protein
MVAYPSFLLVIDPPLKLSIVEKYMQEHLSSTRQKWKQLWKVGGNVARLEGCPIHAWNSLVKYWKSPIVEHESKWMQKVCAMVSNPWKKGLISMARSMSLEVE